MVEKKRVPRCEGKRHQFRGNGYGTFKCGRKATGYVTTKMGFSETHSCCDGAECIRSITGGYDSNWTPFKSEG